LRKISKNVGISALRSKREDGIPWILEPYSTIILNANLERRIKGMRWFKIVRDSKHMPISK
jgi:hypothetical protein